MANTNINNNSLKTCTINIDGMSDCSQILLDKYVDQEAFDVLFVQETRSVCKNKLKLTNMRVVTDTNEAKNRGAAIYARNHISITEIKEISSLSKNMDSAWALIVANNNRYIMGSIYVKLNYGNAITDVLKMLNEAEKISRKYKALGLILAGDFNSKHMSWGDKVHNKYGNELFEKLDNMKYNIHSAKCPTYRTEKGYSVIDLYISSTQLSDKIGLCHTDEEVDLKNGAPLKGHLPVLCNVSQTKKISTPVQVEERIDINSINWVEWLEDIENAITNKKNIQKGTPLEIWSFLEVLINTTTKAHAKSKRSTQHSKPYWTKELTVALNVMRQARKRYNIRNTDPNKEALVKAKEDFDIERKKACEDFILKKTQNLNAAESVVFWKKFNQLFKTKTDKQVDPLKDEDGGIITNNSEMEQKLFSTFFESKHLISSNFDDTFYEEVNMLYDEIKNRNYEREISCNNISEMQKELNKKISIREIKNAIKKTKFNNKSFDNHGMHPKMLHNLGPKALELIQDLFNGCLEKGDWIWNEAEVIFLKKDGKESYALPGSYRPISITSYIGKIFEKILAARLTTFLEQQGLLDPDQEGFTPKRNTHRYLYRLIQEIKNDLKNHTVMTLFIDLEKAFDSIWKKGLITKLFKLNFTGKVLGLIDNFLNTRKVKLNVNGIIGETRECKEYGLPQGSALSPILFKIFLLDFFQSFESSSDMSLFKFADDGSIKIRNKSTKKCVESLEMVADTLNTWTRKWRININCQPNKTEYICFGAVEGNTNKIPQTIKLGMYEIKRVTETKVLGLTVDEHLNFNSHSKKVLNKIQGKWAQICTYTNKHWGFNQKVITRIAQTFFLTSLHYVGTVWMTETNMKEIEKLWYKIMKSAIGATFNLRKTVEEVILGFPPLILPNEMNKLKFYLKLNIKPQKEDRVRNFIQHCYEESSCNRQSEIKANIKEVFKFLSWKFQCYPKDFTKNDDNIVQSKRHENFLNLSPKSCSYTKTMIQKYTEQIWEKKIANEYACEGFQHAPTASCDKIPIPNYVTREQEVLLMSLFYPNNLFNSNIYRHTYQIESPLCGRCGRNEETPFHVILECTDRSAEAYRLVTKVVGENALQNDTITLLKASRNKDFLNLCLNILSQYEYRTHIDLIS